MKDLSLSDPEFWFVPTPFFGEKNPTKSYLESLFLNKKTLKMCISE